MPAKNHSYRQLFDHLGHVFGDENLIHEALTHSTYAYEHRKDAPTSNERLEFLGDAVLDLVVSERLFENPQSLSEGCMTQIRALVVCERNLVQMAAALQLGDWLLLGKGESLTGGSSKPSNLANAMEALIGALFLDAGYETACAIVRRLIEPSFHQALSGQIVFDYKSQLLEKIQAAKTQVIRFEILAEEGPVHERVFTAGVFLDGQLVAKGSGPSKKEAEQQASRLTIEGMEKDLP